MMFRRRSKSMTDDMTVSYNAQCSLQCMDRRQDVEQDVRRPRFKNGNQTNIYFPC